MSIRSELNKTNQYTNEAKAAVLYRGGELTSKDGLEDLPLAIFNIPADGSLGFYTDDEITYKKTVPSGAEEYALVKSVGGMSYKTTNILPYPYAETTVTKYGITFTDNGDGSISVKGTASAATTFNLYAKTDALFDRFIAGNTYTFSAIGLSSNMRCMNNYYTAGATAQQGAVLNPTDQTKTWTLPVDAVGAVIYLYVPSGDTVDCVVKPQIEEGSTATNYKPYFSGLRHSKVTDLVSHGSNYFDISKISSRDDNLGILVNNGDSISVTRVNSLTVPPNGNPKLKDICPNLQVGETYTIYAETTSTYANIYLLGTGVWVFGKSKTITEADLEADVYFYANPEHGVTATISKIRVNKGTTYYDWKPYVGTLDTLEIPKEVQALDGWGLGIDEEYNNHIEWRNDKVYYVKHIEEKIFNGTENWRVLSTNPNLFYLSESPNALMRYTGGRMLVNGYEFTMESLSVDKTCTVSDKLYFMDKSISTINDWKTMLANRYAAGDPLICLYVMETPVETDITEYFTDIPFLRVEGGGTITAVNEDEYENAVPSTIKYTIKTEV